MVAVNKSDRDKKIEITDFKRGNNILASKLDWETIHLLPFLPTRERKRNFNIEKTWRGRYKVKIQANETLNTYDLIVLLYTVKKATEHGRPAGYIDDRPVTAIPIYVKDFLDLRGVINKQANRKTFVNSIHRLKTADVVFADIKTNYSRHTSYIYEYDVDGKYNMIEIFANQRFIDYVLEHGILVNFGRLLKYKNEYAILLDLYIQGTKAVVVLNKRKKFFYAESFTLEEIKEALGLNISNLPDYKKLQLIKNAFYTLHKVGGLPLWQYNRNQKIFCITTDELFF